MTHRARTQRKKFECGHIGYGQECHLCKDIREGRLVKTRQGKYLHPSKVNPQDVS